MQSGLNKTESVYAAEQLVDADMCGVSTHGLALFPGLLALLDSGKVKADLGKIRRRGRVSFIDGYQRLGFTVGRQMIHEVISQSKQQEFAVAVSRGFSHWGRANSYVRCIAQSGRIGVAILKTRPVMAIYGTSVPNLGNNVLAIGLPGNPPLIVDFCTSIYSVGQLRQRCFFGEYLMPAVAGFDSAGRATRDVRQILDDGALLPFGAAKGSALAFFAQAMLALFGDRVDYRERTDLYGESRGGDFSNSAIVIAFPGFAPCQRGRFSTWLHEWASELSEFNATLPGWRSEQNRSMYSEVVEIPAQVLSEIKALASRFPSLSTLVDLPSKKH